MKKIEKKIRCNACGGTGIYKGFAEGEGFGIVCRRCDGTGNIDFVLKYNDPVTTPIVRKNIVTVLECNVGIRVGIDGEFTKDSFGGMPYQDWLAGKSFPEKSETREYSCPAQWCQCTGKPSFSQAGCTYGMFSRCNNYSTKNKCWEIYDKENFSPEEK